MNSLGLAIAKKVIDRLDGTIEISSEKGHGTTVRMTIPFKPGEPDEGIIVECAMDGQEAVDKFANTAPGYYDAQSEWLGYDPQDPGYAKRGFAEYTDHSHECQRFYRGYDQQPDCRNEPASDQAAYTGKAFSGA